MLLCEGQMLRVRGNCLCIRGKCFCCGANVRAEGQLPVYERQLLVLRGKCLCMRGKRLFLIRSSLPGWNPTFRVEPNSFLVEPDLSWVCPDPS
jgi:hypothetical protein